MIYEINKELIMEAIDLGNEKNANKFARRAVKAINNPKGIHTKVNAALLAAPVSAIVGGAIGNSIHGSDGVDDEYDVTGAIVGGGLGMAGAATALAGGAGTKGIEKRLAKDNFYLSPNESNYLKAASNIAKHTLVSNDLIRRK